MLSVPPYLSLSSVVPSPLAGLLAFPLSPIPSGCWAGLGNPLGFLKLSDFPIAGWSRGDGRVGRGLLPFLPLPFRTERYHQMTTQTPEIPTFPNLLLIPESLEDAMESATHLSILVPQREKLRYLLVGISTL